MSSDNKAGREAPDLLVRGSARGGRSVELRGTQSFVHIMSAIWRRPSLTGLEILWRWAFGSIALYLIVTSAQRIWLTATRGSGDPATLGLAHLTLLDPMATATHLAEAYTALAPSLAHAAVRIAPVLAVLWLIASTFGRSAVTRRLAPALAPRRATLLALNTLRLAAMLLILCAWFACLFAAQRITIAAPIARDAEPNLVGYFALIITATLLLFLAWASASWLLRLAPILAQARNLTTIEALRAAANPGPLRAKLFEINLVMGIVKIALIVLAMVFSATPLPFESFTTPAFLTSWWIADALLYCILSDFFHVVHTAAFFALWQAYDAPFPTHS